MAVRSSYSIPFSQSDMIDSTDCASATRRRGSKAKSHASLLKILHIISTVPPVVAAASSPDMGSEIKDPGLGIADGFCGLQDAAAVESFSADSSGPSSCSTIERDAGVFRLGSGNGVVGDRLDGGRKDERSESSHRSLILLIEAAKLIFGEFEETVKPDPESENGSQIMSSGSETKKNEAQERKSRRRKCSAGLAAETGGHFEETPSPPVVRSKRGRLQIVPFKYRDSMVGPFAGTSKSNHRFPGAVFPATRKLR